MYFYSDSPDVPKHGNSIMARNNKDSFLYEVKIESELMR